MSSRAFPLPNVSRGDGKSFVAVVDRHGAEQSGGRRGDPGVVQRGADGDTTAAVPDVHRCRVLRGHGDGQPRVIRRYRPRLDVAAGRRAGCGMHDGVDGVVRDRCGHRTIRGLLRQIVRSRRIGEGIEMLVQIHAAPTWCERLSEPDAPHRRRDLRTAEQHLAPELRPGGDGFVHFHQRRGHRRRQLTGVENPKDERNLVPRAEPRQRLHVDVTDYSVEDGPVGFEVESLDVQQTPVTGRHQHRQSPSLGLPSQGHLDVEGVAFVDHHVRAVQEFGHRLDVETVLPQRHSDVGVDLRDTAGGDHGLVHAEVENGAGNPVQVGQFEGVEVREPQAATRTFQRKSQRDRVTDAQSDDPHGHVPEAFLFLRGDLVPIPVQPQQPERCGSEQTHHRPSPRVVRPHRSLVQRTRSRCGDEGTEALDLLVEPIDEDHRGVAAETVQYRRVPGVALVEQQCGVLIVGFGHETLRIGRTTFPPVPVAMPADGVGRDVVSNSWASCMDSARPLRLLRSHHISRVS